MPDPADQPPWPPLPQGAGGDNPFAAPRARLGTGGGLPGDPAAGRGLVGHVLPVAILMIVQGALELLFGVFLLAAAVMMPMIMPDNAGTMDMPVSFKWMMMGTYGVMGTGGLVAGVLHVVGGICGLSFRRRMLGVVALAVGMASIFTCYCGPTSIGLGIYGLITYFNPAVIAAFALGDAGTPVAEIRTRFGG